MNVNLSKSSLSFFLSKTEIRLRYRKISTMMFLSIKKVFYTPQNNYGNTTVRVLGFAEILTIFQSNLHKVDTCLQRTQWVGPVGAPRKKLLPERGRTAIHCYITTRHGTYCCFSYADNWELVKPIVGAKFRRSHVCLHSQAGNRLRKLIALLFFVML